MLDSRQIFWYNNYIHLGIVIVSHKNSAVSRYLGGGYALFKTEPIVMIKNIIKKLIKWRIS